MFSYKKRRGSMKKEKLTFYHIDRLKSGKDILLDGKLYESNVHYFEKDHSFRESFFESCGVKRSFYDDNVEEKEDKKLYTLTQLKKEFELYPKSKSIVKGYMYTKKYGCYPLFLKKDCFSIAKTDEEKERNRILQEKRAATAKINRTCEFCEGVERKKIKTFWEEKRVCPDCLDKFEEEKEFQEAKIHHFQIKGIRFDESRIELALKIQSEVENNRKIKLSLEREPANEHDQNAIKIMHAGEQLGYVDARIASKVAKILDDGGQVDIAFDHENLEIYEYNHYYTFNYEDDFEVRKAYKLFATITLK